MESSSSAPAEGRTLLSIWRATFSDAMQGESEAWLYVAKTLLAVYVACGVAMALKLPTPGVSMVTVLVVMNSKSGMVLAKSFYRIVGTLFGVTASVLIVALFSQQPVLLLTAIAIWSGICAAGALLLRGFKSYGFVLSGYTVAMIVLPVVDQPTLIFDHAVDRMTEVLVGLAVAALIYDGLFPRQLSGQVRELAESNLDYLLEQVRVGLRSEDAERGHVLHVETARKATSFEELLSLAVFEGPWLSAISRALRCGNHYFMQAFTRLQSFRHLRQRLHAQGDTEVVGLLQQLAGPLIERLDADCNDGPALVGDLRRLTDEMTTRAEVIRKTLPDDARQTFDTGVALMRRLMKALVRCARAFLIARPSNREARSIRKTNFSRVYDPVAIWMTLLRTTCICLGVGLLWMASGWTAGATGLFMVIALVMMLAPLPNPLAAVKMAAAGHIAGLFFALPCFSILPSLTTFPLFVLGTAPFLILLVYVTTRPGWAGFGIPMNISFLAVLLIGQQPSLEYTQFLNEMLAMTVGVLIAAAGFLLFPSVSGTAGQYRRYLGFLNDSVRIAASAPLQGLAEKVESRNHDICIQLVSQLPENSRRRQRFLQRAVLAQQACYVLISLREDLNGTGLPSARGLIEDTVRLLAAVWCDEKNRGANRAQLNMTLALALHELEPNSLTPLHEHLYLLVDVLDDWGSEVRRPVSAEVARAH